MFRKDTNVLSRLSMKNISALLMMLFMATAPVAAQNARVQVIHNSPYAAAATVDIYINDALTLDDFAFQDATEFLDLTAGVEISIDVTAPDAPDNSSPLYNLTVPSLDDGATYVLVAAGDPTGSGGPAFEIFVNATGQEAAAMAGNVEFMVFHGSPDAPTVDVVARPELTLVDDVAFGGFSPYLSVGPADYDIDITTDDQSAVAYSAVAGLAEAAGAALVVLASGFLAPAEMEDPGFELLAVFADGSTAVLAQNNARVNIVHNSPYAAAAEVDVYVNDALAVDNFCVP